MTAINVLVQADAVHGFAQLTTVGQSGITTRILKRWPVAKIEGIAA